MFNHKYLVQFVYQNKDTSGINYQTVEAKNKQQAVEITVQNLTDSTCDVVSVKRVSKRIMEITQKHNEKVWEAQK